MRIERHRKWAVALVLLGILSLTSGLVQSKGLWSSYALDVFGPAWNYILFRRLFRTESTRFSEFFTPETTLTFIISVCFLIEGAQYLNLYDATYDPFDLVAYLSLIVPCYALDRWLLNKSLH